MICLRCGYCCIKMDVIIMIDPDKGTTEGNLKHKPYDEICQHLNKTDDGYECGIHEHPNFKITPCHDFDQIGAIDADCRLGTHYKGKI